MGIEILIKIRYFQWTIVKYSLSYSEMYEKKMYLNIKTAYSKMF